MALRVNSNVAALNALRHLNHTEKELSRNLERLSSGRRLNRAAAIDSKFRNFHLYDSDH